MDILLIESTLFGGMPTTTAPAEVSDTLLQGLILLLSIRYIIFKNKRWDTSDRILFTSLHFRISQIVEEELEMNAKEDTSRIVVFRTAEYEVDWLFKEVNAGRLRQGWGALGLALKTTDGEKVEKSAWTEAYRAHGNAEPSPRRFAILSYMLDLNDRDIVVVPKMPEWNQFTIARVSSGYKFGTHGDGDRQDFNHLVRLDPESVRTFHYRSNEEAYLISGLFSRANHQSPISFCYSAAKVEAALELLTSESSSTATPLEQLLKAATDDALKQAAEALRKRVNDWNGSRFEKAVRQTFADQGYELMHHRRYDRKGADADMLVSPPATHHSFFLPSKIAVQVKWKQGVDENDVQSVQQILNWVKSMESNASTCVISSASEFTCKAKDLAAANNVLLICGMQTMCFLLGIADRYRADWD